MHATDHDITKALNAAVWREIVVEGQAIGAHPPNPRMLPSVTQTACFLTPRLPKYRMSPHTRAMVAAAAHAFIFGNKVTGVHDHEADKDLRIAVEARGDRLQGFDGDRSAKFSGTLTELYDASDDTFVSLKIDGVKAQGYDRRSSSHYSLIATDKIMQLYDHGAGSWFAFSIQTA